MEIKIIKKPNSYKTGGEIHIKKSHEGLFTLKADRAGMGVLEFASHVLANKENYSSETVKQANFARNAAKWHAQGGFLNNLGFFDERGIAEDYSSNASPKTQTFLLNLGFSPNGSFSQNGEYASYGSAQFNDKLQGTAAQMADAYKEASRRDQGAMRRASGLSRKDFGALMLGSTAPLFAEGGNLRAEGGAVLGGYHTNGADWQQPGGFHIIGNGGTHEENKNEGVLQGTDPNGVPNLVEENEVVYNDYVFSARLTVPKRRQGKDKELSDLAWEEKMLKPYEGKTYAEAALKAYKEVQERPDDPIARRGMETILGVLANSQEKERAKKEHQDASDQINEMSGQEFAQAKAAEEQQQAIEQAAQELAMQQLMQEQLTALLEQYTQEPSSEEAAIMQQLMMQQLPLILMACGGKLHADGGNMLEPVVEGLDIQQSLPQQEEEQPSFMNIDDPEDLSTTQLNSTIEEIIQYAKENKLRDIVKAGRKAKKSSREDKEEYVDNSKDAIEDYIQLQTQKELQALEQLAQEQQALLVSEELVTQLLMLLPVAQEQTVLQELETQTQGLQFANGGKLLQQELLALMQLLATMYSQYLKLTNPQLFEQTSTELQLYLQQALLSGTASQEELLMIPIQYYASRAQQDAEFLKQLQQTQGQQYALGGSMSLNNTDGGQQTVLGKVFAGTKLAPAKLYEDVDAKTYKDFLKYLSANKLSIKDFIKYYEEQNKGTKWNRKNYNKDLATQWIDSVNTENKRKVAKNYVEQLNYLQLLALAKAMDIDTSEIKNDTNREESYREAILNHSTDYTKYNEAFTNSDILTFRPKDWTPYKWDWTITQGKEKKKINSRFFTGDNALKNLDDYYESRLADYLKLSGAKNWTPSEAEKNKGQKVTSKFHMTGAQARGFNLYLEETLGEESEKSKELAKLFRASHTEGTDWNGDWEYQNKFTPEGKVRENSEYREYYLNPANGGAEVNKGKLDSQWGRLHSPKLNFVYEVPIIKERNAYYVNGQEIDASDFLNEENQWSNPTWLATKDTDLINDDGSIVHRYNLTRNALPEIDESLAPVNTVQEGVDFQLPSNWPWLAGLGLLAGTTLYNAIKPVDYSNADAVIEAAKEAGKYQPIGFRPIGDYLTYRPLDRNYEGNKVRSAMAAERRALANLSGGNRGTAMAGILASDYNLINQLGDVDRKAAESNREQEAKVAEFNRGTNEFNSEGFLKADMSNQDAMSRASQAKLEGLAKGYAMRQAADDAKASAINAGISGIAENLFGLYQQNYNNALIKYGMDTGTLGTANYNWKKHPKAQGGQLKTRRRGLTF